MKEKKSWNQQEKTDTLPIKVNNWNEFGKFIRKYAGLKEVAWHISIDEKKKRAINAQFYTQRQYPSKIKGKNQDILRWWKAKRTWCQ